MCLIYHCDVFIIIITIVMCVINIITIVMCVIQCKLFSQFACMVCTVVMLSCKSLSAKEPLIIGLFN